MRRTDERMGRALAALFLCSGVPLLAADDAVSGNAQPGPASLLQAAQLGSEIEQLKKMLADQQQQINELRQALAHQTRAAGNGAAASLAMAGSSTASDYEPAVGSANRKPGLVAGTERNSAAASLAMAGSSTAPANEPAVASAYRNLGQVAGTAVVLPGLPAALAIPAVPLPQKTAVSSSSSKNPCEAGADTSTPAYLRLGSVCIVPIGFMDLTAVWRDKNAGSSLGTNFGSVPFNNTTNAKNSEFRFTPQNSRIGFRIDGDWKGTHFIGYNEFDFLGTGASTTLTVTNGAFVPRLRLYWVDARKGKVEFLAGQSWSMLTPNRSGISALPGNLFYTQVLDVNYMAGLTWTRQGGMRVLIHPNDKVTFGFSAENADQYIGGSAGGSGITLPAGLTVLASTQLDNGPNIGTASTVLSVPTLHPDFIAKLAIDPTSRFHFEVAGLERTFKIWNPSTSGPGAGQYSTKAGGGIQVGLNVEIVKNFRLISTNYWSDGGGRYLFGQAPDLMVRADGSLSLIRSGGTVDGFEARIKNWLFYAYYGGIFIARNTALDANGASRIGYGYSGSPNSQNRAINEFTFGLNQTIWASPRYGSVNAMWQYEYLSRNPWFVAAGAPKAAHDNTIYFNLRYTLPGGMPSF